VRIWDLEPEELCRSHLLGEHRELHAVWTILTEGKRGYSAHPETLRWRGRLKALYRRHARLVAEMERRGFAHRSPLDPDLATGSGRQTELLESVASQRERLAERGCDCFRGARVGPQDLSPRPPAQARR
jgi:hypothetical protein